jgi:hypothetical protein
MECHISDGPQEPDDLLTYEEPEMNEIPQEYDGGDVIETPAAKHVIEYNITDAALAELAEQYGGMVVTTDNLDEGKEARKAVRDVRLAVEERRKELKADALAYGKAVDGKAKEIQAKIAKVEEPLAEQLDAIANAEKLAEEKRVATIESYLGVLRAYGLETEDKTLAELQAWQEQLNELEITEEIYQEFREQAVGAKAESESRLRIAITRKQAAEEEAARLEEQRLIQAQEAENLAAERAKLEEAQAKLRERRMPSARLSWPHSRPRSTRLARSRSAKSKRSEKKQRPRQRQLEH